MKKIFETFLVFMILQAPIFANVNTIYDDSYDTNYYEGSYNNQSLNYTLSALENDVFQRNFEGITVNSRLERLERKLFGKTYPNKPTSSRIQMIEANLDERNLSNSDKKIILKLENKLFSRNYLEDTPSNRIKRLELKVFKAVQRGDLQTRISMLESSVMGASRSYTTRQYVYPNGTIPYQRTYKQRYYPQNKHGLKSWLGSYLNGVPTGWTTSPNHSQNDFETFSWGSENCIERSYGRYECTKSQTGGNSSVTIIND